MKANFWLTRKWLFVVSLLFLGVTEARAEIMLSDTFSLMGYLRHQLAVHTGEKNPNNVNQTDRNSINLSRTFFQTEWTYLPNNNFKLYSKVKLISDQTEALDNKLNDYNAFPLSTPRYGTYLRATNDNELNAEMSELYADVSLGNLWVRLGRQQIVWGEMIAARFLDQINPLDLSWHARFEPEEFENIRVPQWTLRARYNVPQMVPLPWLADAYLEGFVNPGDVSPNISPALGSPFGGRAPSPLFNVQETDRRGDVEYGFRIGGRVGQVAGTLNYFSLYSDSGYWESKQRPNTLAPPSPANRYPTNNIYPRTDLYGASLNYSFSNPINTTVTYEGIYSPNEPYYDAVSPLVSIRYSNTLRHAIQFSRSTFVFPTPISAMSIQLQFSQTLVKDHAKIKFTSAPSGNSIDGDQNVISLILSQFFSHNRFNLYLRALYDLDDSHQITPGFKYSPGDHWIFDIYAQIIGGAERRPGRFGGNYWADEVSGRVTYQF
ncbi:MAG: hypothetical protein Q7R34_16460 [Dehalococcoidia bacterium]|nr:hypothetical protein [Dehalococcoidia bacterium]